MNGGSGKTVKLNRMLRQEEFKNLRGFFNGDSLQKNTLPPAERGKNRGKIVPTLEEAIRRSGLRNGMTISFHHHFRDGDGVVNLVAAKLAEMGFKDLTLAAPALTAGHTPLIAHIKNGVIRRIETSGIRGALGEEISRGLMELPVVFRSHGGRARAVETGALPIDVAFLGAPSCDPSGNAGGYSPDRDNPIRCGSLGYAAADARYAAKTVIIAGGIAPFPNLPCGIPGYDVDYVVPVEAIGDPAGFMTTAAPFTGNAADLRIAETAAEVIDASGRLAEDFSFQTGTGGASLAVLKFLREKMIARGIKAGFALGGITGAVVDLHEEGLVKTILDFQSFDLKAADSLKKNLRHLQIPVSCYAGFGEERSAVNGLDVAVLSALEVDCGFNANVLTGSDGIIRGAIGGHQDTAYGAALSVVVIPLTRGKIPCITRQVNTLVTPGKTVDVIVTDQGIAVNPLREDLRQKLRRAGLPLRSIHDLRAQAEDKAGSPPPVRHTDKVAGLVTYRDGSIIDLIYGTP